MTLSRAGDAGKRQPGSWFFEPPLVVSCEGCHGRPGSAMFNAKNHLVLLTQAIVWLSVTATAFGQATPPKPLSDAEFVALLQSRLKQVDELRDLDDAAKAKVKGLYQQALDEMEAAKRWTAKAAQFEKQAANAPGELEQTKATLAGIARPAGGGYSRRRQPAADRAGHLQA